MRSSISLLISAALFIGCQNNSTEPNRGLYASNENLIVKTDNATYALNAPILITLYNGTNTNAYFGHCDFRLGFFIEWKQNNTWTEKANVAIVCLAIFPVGAETLEPQQSYSDNISIREAGIYRLKFPFGCDENNVFADSLFSNVFTVQ